MTILLVAAALLWAAGFLLLPRLRGCVTEQWHPRNIPA